MPSDSLTHLLLPGFWRRAEGRGDRRLPGFVAGEPGQSQLRAANPELSRAFEMPVPSSITPPLADPAVVQRLVAGDEQALAALYDSYGSLAYSLALAMVRDEADAEEVVADAFGQMWRSASSFDASRGNVAAWVTTIVRTRALDLLRARRRRSRMLDQAAAASDDTSSPGLSHAPPPADRGAEQSEAAVLVRRSLAELPAPQRLVLELAYFSGLSQSEIAEQLAEPLGTIKTRMRAGMEKLRAALRPLLEAGT